VCAALQLHGYTEVADQHLRDDEAVMRHHLGEILETRDVLVLSGGVSKGKFDFVPSALKALGVTEVINQVAQRPGRPMWFGIGLQNQLVFGLPGNPVSTLLCLIRYVLPALAVATGQSLREPERLAVSEAMSGRKMTYFMPVTLVNRGGATLGEPHAPQGSGDFLALAGTDGFVELPPRPEGYPAGFVADFFRW
jgi:molybdopterin molybdotransferase